MIDSRTCAIFSLFHHNVYKSDGLFNYNTEVLYYNSKKSKPTATITDLSQKIYQIVTSSIEGCNDNEISLTLTGGMDSRVILACLLNAGVKPNCFTYGNAKAKDVVFANGLAKEFGLIYHNAASEPPTREWYHKWVIETIKRDNGNSHLHRAHRTAAIAEHYEIFKPKVLFTGHMGGEGLRGLTYNSYFASPFFELVNEDEAEPLVAAKEVLSNYFLKAENINFDQLLYQVKSLPWMNTDRQINKYYFIFDLVGKIHHAQDIRLFQSYVPKVVPVYLQKSYLETLFGSPYHLLNKKKGILGQLNNPFVHSKLIEQIYPKLLDYPLVNDYKPQEFLRGLWYYVPAKLIRGYLSRTKYSPTFSYGKWFVDYVKEHAQNISHDIWEIFNKEDYLKALYSHNHRKDEGYWHKFSNPIFFDLINKTLK